MQILISVVCVPPFLGWGAYSPEGLLVTCSYDYLKQEWNELTFMYYAFAFNYTVPMLTVIFFYIQIVKAVVAHEAAMKAQAKKMNVDSLKSNQKDNEASAEVKIAKVAITNVLLWIVTWTPYAIVAMIGVFGNQMLITPLVAQLPSFLGKYGIFYLINFLLTTKTKSCSKNVLLSQSCCLCRLPSQVQGINCKGDPLPRYW